MSSITDIGGSYLSLFGVRTRQGHWLRPGLKLIDLIPLCLEKGFEDGIENLEHRIRFRFPPYRLSEGGRLRRPIRFGGERLYRENGTVGEYLFYQTRSLGSSILNIVFDDVII